MGTDDASQMMSVAGTSISQDEALRKLIKYPRRTPVAFDFLGTGPQGHLNEADVSRTRKVSSRISHAQATYFVDRGASAPWLSGQPDLANADPKSDGLFVSMNDLYWHFAEDAPKGVAFAKISKVLYVKYPSLYPILDSHLRTAYAPFARQLISEHPSFGWRRRTWVAIRNDLLQARSSGAIGKLRTSLSRYSAADVSEQQRVRKLTELSDLRLLDILVW